MAGGPFERSSIDALAEIARLDIPASTLEYKIKSLKIHKGQFKFDGSPRDNH